MKQTKRTSGTEQSAKRLTIRNGLLLQVSAQEIATSLGEFLANPLPVLVRLEINEVLDGLIERIEKLIEAKKALLRKYGATENEGGSLTLEPQAKGYAECQQEYAKLVAATSQLPVTKRIVCPTRVRRMGKIEDVVCDQVAQEILSAFVEWERTDG